MTTACWRQWLLPLLLFLTSLVIALLGDRAAELLRFQRDAVAAGEWWRLVTGNLVHLGWSHLWLNSAGLLMVWLLVGNGLSTRAWSLQIVLTMMGISLGLFWWLPQLSWYVGLSGLLHGMLMAGALRLALHGDREAMAVIAVVTAKVGWEMWQGPLPGSREMAGGEVVVQAHALGTLCGAAYAAALAATGRVRKLVSA